MGARSICLAVATTLLLVGSTSAADLAMAPPATAEVDTSFAWDGGYVGGFGIWYNQDGYASVGAVVGANFLPSESLLLGVEGSVAYFFPTVPPGITGLEGTIGVRGGFVAGPALIFASLGERYAFTLGGDLTPYAGAGVELAVGDNLSIRAEGRYYWTSSGTAIIAGMMWHPN